MLSLRYSPPSADLRGHVSSYYLFRANLEHVVDTVRADLPQLRFMLAGRGSYTFGDGTTRPCPRMTLIGATTAATRFEAEGPLWVFGAGLLPAGWCTFVGSSASEMTDGVEDAGAVFGPIVPQTFDIMCGARAFEEMVAIADMMFRELLDRRQERPIDWLIRATDMWLMSETSPRVDALLKETGLSPRQLERLTNRIYGAPPKLLARKYRTLRVASRMVVEDESWKDLAADAFYDQSHFIRDFKQFTGQTPRQFQLNPSPVTKLMSARRRLGSSLPLIALDS